MRRPPPNPTDNPTHETIRAKVFALRALPHAPSNDRLLDLVPEFRRWYLKYEDRLVSDGVYGEHEAVIEYTGLIYETKGHNVFERCWALAGNGDPPPKAVQAFPKDRKMQRLALTCKLLSEAMWDVGTFSRFDRPFPLTCRQAAWSQGHVRPDGTPIPAHGRTVRMQLISAGIIVKAVSGKPGGRGKDAADLFRYTGDCPCEFARDEVY
jgi:hypothetical protein